MQRDSIYQKYIKYTLFFVVGIIYESITSVYPLLTPLYGVVFYFLLQHVEKKEFIFLNFLSFAYIFVFEIDKGFAPFSFPLFFVIYFFFIYDRVERVFNNVNYKILFHILSGYLWYYVINVIIDYIFNLDVITFNMRYFLYILVDTLITVVLFS